MNITKEFIYFQVKDLKYRKPNHPFKFVGQSEICKTNKKFDKKKFKRLINGKSIMPYDQITSWKYLIETENIPPREHYYNKLNYNELSLEDYKNVKKFFKVFGTFFIQLLYI